MRERLLSNNIYENLPEILKTITRPFEDRERDIVLLSSLGVLSAAIPNVAGIYKNNKVYGNLYILVIAPPASGKGNMMYAKQLIESIHQKVLTDSIKKAKEARQQEREEKIPLQLKIVPTNISSSEMYNVLKNVHDSGIMIDSEADTLSIMFKNDWGNFSDVLRKAFHHESISMSRKLDNVHFEIKTPKLSLVLSGTPDQIRPLVKSKENGLFSRFAYYTFDELEPWKDVFESDVDYNTEFLNIGKNDIFKLYGVLSELEDEIKFEFPPELKIKFNERMSEILSVVQEHHPKLFQSNVKRHGVICFKICMILTVLRNKDKLEQKVLVCNELDFDIAIEITSNLLQHALEIFHLLGDRESLSVIDKKVLNEFDGTFTRMESIEAGKKFNIPVRTMDDKLVQWGEKNIIRKIKRGTYEKGLM